jgi:hypothetical protein
MMRRFRSKFAGFRSTVLAGGAALAVLSLAATASAQEIQITGPLAGAPAVRQLRLHREGRFEIAPGASFTLLDQYARTIMPGGTLTYHFTDWIGVGVFGGYGLQYAAGLADNLQEKAIDDRHCDANPAAKACRLTAVNLTRKGAGGTGQMMDDQLGHIGWLIAPQVKVIPFRGKLAFLGSLFVDTDVDFFVGPAFIGVKERAECGPGTSGPADCSKSFTLASRVAVAPTFGLGLNFYPSQFVGFGFEWRGLPFSWNTSGFDNHGGGTNGDFPDLKVNADDREFHFNSMFSLRVSVQLPTKIKTSE